MHLFSDKVCDACHVRNDFGCQQWSAISESKAELLSSLVDTQRAAKEIILDGAGHTNKLKSND